MREIIQKNKSCETKYPILLVHGVFFRDSTRINYWGRIPKELEKNGAKIYYGNHQSADSVKKSGEEIAERIREITALTGAKKLNLIAHSKGGLDCRSAIARCEIASLVASLTTINTPHRGCAFADYLLKNVPEKIKNKIADTYNYTLKKLGDPNPNFLAAVQDLTEENCITFNNDISGTSHTENIFCQSVGSKLIKATGGNFPLNLTYHLTKIFDGDNDGLVGENSFPFGEKYLFLLPPGKRGISHGDMVDMSRRNIDGFDVRKFYVELVSDLKARGF